MTDAAPTTPKTNPASLEPAAYTWLQRSGDWLRSVGIPTELGQRNDEAGDGRDTNERLKATLRRGDELLSPRELRRLLADLQSAWPAELLLEEQVQDIGASALGHSVRFRPLGWIHSPRRRKGLGGQGPCGLPPGFPL